MKIDYFEVGDYGWGLIFKRTIDTEDSNYISHTNETVTFTDSYVDNYWETMYVEVTRERVFESLKAVLLSGLIKKRNELDQAIKELEETTEENFNKKAKSC